MRAKQGGMPKPASVELVSALKGWGVEQLLVRLHREVGTTGDVWVVSALSLESDYMQSRIRLS